MDSLIIPARFRGPPNSGNGGYVAGAIAERFRPARAAAGLTATTASGVTASDATASGATAPGAMAANTIAGDAATADAIEVTLRAPIPLDTAMRIDRPDDDQLRVMQGETLIAEARRAPLAIEVPAPPTFAAALAARQDSPSFIRNINPLLPDGTGFHPVCACCGADVPEDEGLHVYAAPVPGFAGVAAAWQPRAGLGDADGLLPEAIVWTALDCPGQFAFMAAGIRTGLLGRMTARVLHPVAAGAELRVIGWCLEIEGRKHFAGTALFDADGTLCAYARQTWIGRME